MYSKSRAHTQACSYCNQLGLTYLLSPCDIIHQIAMTQTTARTGRPVTHKAVHRNR